MGFLLLYYVSVNFWLDVNILVMKIKDVFFFMIFINILMISIRVGKFYRF